MLFAAARVLRARQSWRFSGLTEAPIGAIITKWSEGRRPAFSTFACTAIMKTPLIIIAASLVSLPLAADITLPGRRAPKLPPLPPDWTEEEEPPAAQTPAPTAPGTPISAGAADPAATSPGALADSAAGAVPSAGQSPALGIPGTSTAPGTPISAGAADPAATSPGALADSAAGAVPSAGQSPALGIPGTSTAPGTPISAGAADPAATSPGAPADPAAGAVPSAGQSPASGIPATSGIPGTSALPTAADAAQAATGAASPKPAPNPQDEALAEGLDEMTDILRSVHDAASADAAALELTECVREHGLNRLSGASLPQAMQMLNSSGAAPASFRNYMQEVLRVTAARFYGSTLLQQVLGDMN